MDVLEICFKTLYCAIILSFFPSEVVNLRFKDNFWLPRKGVSFLCGRMGETKKEAGRDENKNGK